MTSASIRGHHLVQIRFDTESAVLGPRTGGTQLVVTVVGGEFRGNELAGSVMAGSDWVLRHHDGTMSLDVRAQLRTDDAVLLLLTYRGIAKPRPDGQLGVLVTPTFTAPEQGRYAWLNDLVCIGTGSVSSGQVAYDIYVVDAVD
jgi:hypothetical protein